ncbi:YhgN family NAAT transporter [Sulfurospirillum sp.]|uniref:YhgN family NAAT transporter n=1 Tax=Sulfurospirillum sp. TaxID=2053622 RepID=UPI002FDDBA83
MNADFSIVSTAILLFFVIDPFGAVPVILTILKDVEMQRKKIVIIREMLFGLGILMLFLFGGELFLNIFHLETESVRIAGAVIFFVIGIKMIFPGEEGSSGLYGTSKEPFMVPIAMPLIAGPSTLATLLVLSKSNSDSIGKLFIALLLAWFISALIMYLSPMLYKLLREKGLSALERLMGMLLLMMSVQMFIDGIRGLIHTF